MKKENETVIMTCHRHWVHFVVPVLLELLFISMLVTANTNLLRVVYLVIVIIIPLYIYITYKSDYLELTETKLTEHRGFIRSQMKTTPVARIQNISYSNGLLGKIFRYHIIRIDNAGSSGTEYAWKHMAHAKEFVEKTKSLIE